MIVRAAIGTFFVFCIVAIIGAVAWGGIGLVLDEQETRRVEANAETEVAHTEQVQVEATRAATLGEQELELARLEAQIIKARADLIIASSLANAVTSDAELVRQMFDMMEKMLTQQERQEDTGATINTLWARFNGIMTVVELAGTYFLARKQ